MANKLIVLLIIFFLSATPAFAATYYVASTGNDASAGTDQTSPWQTIAKVNASTFLPGDQIFFNRGDTWREQLNITWSGTVGHPITFGSYGSGNLPKLQTSASWNDPSAWTNLGNNIWQTTHTGTTGSENFTNTNFSTNTTGWSLWKNAGNGASATMSQTTTLGEYKSSPGGLKIVSTNSGTTSSDIQFYNSNGITIQNNKYYELSFWAKATTPFQIATITMRKSGSPYTNYGRSAPIPIVGTTWQQYKLFYLANTTISDAVVSFYLGRALPNGATLYLDDISLKQYTSSQTIIPYVDIGNISFNSDASFGHKKTTSTADLQNQGDFYYDPNISTVYLYSTSNPATFYSSIELGLTLITINLNANSYITVKNLHILNSAWDGIRTNSGANNIVISDNQLSNIGGGTYIDSNGNSTRFGNSMTFWNSAHDITVERNKIWEVYDTAITHQGTAGSAYNIYIRNNVIWNTEMGIEEFLKGSGAMYNIYVDNNIIDSSGSQSSHVDRPVADGQSGQRARGIMFWASNVPTIHDIYIRNNIISGTTEKLMQFTSPFINATNLVVRNNLLWTSNLSNDAVQWGGTNISAIANYNLNHISCGSSGCWQNDTSQASGNIVGQPQYADGTNHNYTLQSTSPAINTGVNISANFTDDYAGNIRPQGAGYDIGAYEYVGGQTPPSPSPKPGDANGDNKVDGVDYVVWLNHYNQSISGLTNGDFNNSGKVDGVDYVIWVNNYGT